MYQRYRSAAQHEAPKSTPMPRTRIVQSMTQPWRACRAAARPTRLSCTTIMRMTRRSARGALCAAAPLAPARRRRDGTTSQRPRRAEATRHAADAACRGAPRSRASWPTTDARIYRGHRRAGARAAPGRRTCRRAAGEAGDRRRRRPQFRGRRPARGDPQHPRRHPGRELHDRSGGRRPGHHPHVVGHPARRTAGHARNAAADERRDDGQGGRDLQDRPAGRRGARQRDAAARQLATARCRRAFPCRSCRCATSACARCCACSSRSRKTRRPCASTSCAT